MDFLEGGGGGVDGGTHSKKENQRKNEYVSLTFRSRYFNELH